MPAVDPAPASAATDTPTASRAPQPSTPELAGAPIQYREAHQQGAHQHGAASLGLAVDGRTVTAELDVPMHDLLGFEHAPATPQQHATVERAQATLADPAALVSFNAEAGCEPQPPADAVALFEEHGDKAGEHSHAPADPSAHRDVLVTHSYRCSEPGRLRSATIGIVSGFPLMKEVRVVYLSDTRQSAFTVSATNATIDLRP